METYEASSGESITDNMKITIIVQRAPKDLRERVQLQEFTTFVTFRSKIEQYIHTVRLWSGSGTTTEPVPMDVSSINVLKGSGKAKGKGKDKGKDHFKGGKFGGKTEFFPGYCDHCWGYGHKKAQCKKINLPSPGAGKDKGGKGRGKGKERYGKGKDGGIHEVFQDDADRGSGGVMTIIGAEEENFVYGISGSGQLDGEQDKNLEFMVDSGAFTHVVPTTEERGRVVHGKQMRLRTANGEELQHAGTMEMDLPVKGKLKDEKTAVQATRCNVNRVLLSAGRLCDQGYEITLQREGGKNEKFRR